ncbi:AbrB/MazE/SpoVT family DNA-binding domain-containing protein [Longimicrobium sp.]|uniref:AbrB/MazE/SpoVT family DNA-binding domain-containing protein n=1 Tax=Longimicrobium sp. TaxID=2029185 RepID=UPI002F924AE6
MRESRLNSKSQIVVPASVRHLGLEPGDRVRFEPHAEGYLLLKSQDAPSWVDQLVSLGGGELRGYAEQLLRERHAEVDECRVSDEPMT